MPVGLCARKQYQACLTYKLHESPAQIQTFHSLEQKRWFLHIPTQYLQNS